MKTPILLTMLTGLAVLPALAQDGSGNNNDNDSQGGDQQPPEDDQPQD